ncbi:hypothetical protein I4U23_004392 [Adineta vaga]|nr:hypothetical protein I4U23_004392 [Adineta vaga]
MGGSESTRKCLRSICKHLGDCTKLDASGKPDGSWPCSYSGPSSALRTACNAIGEAKAEALEYGKK